jgi:hypothetical protein
MGVFETLPQHCLAVRGPTKACASIITRTQSDRNFSTSASNGTVARRQFRCQPDTASFCYDQVSFCGKQLHQLRLGPTVRIDYPANCASFGVSGFEDSISTLFGNVLTFLSY